MDKTIHEVARENVCKDQRNGQAYFNAAYSIDSAWADSVRATDLDPFHKDDKVPDFLKKWEHDHKCVCGRELEIAGERICDICYADFGNWHKQNDPKTK
jgi:hypothetical protein